MKRPRDRGFTLVELLVVIAIIAVLIAVMIPAMQASRDVARRAACGNNLMQLSLALQNYESAYQVLPAGVTNPAGPIQNVPDGLHLGWLVRALPYLDEKNLFDHVDLSASVYGPKNAQARSIPVEGLVCPAESVDMLNVLAPRADAAAGAEHAAAPTEVKVASSNYAGCHHDVEAPINVDNRGVLFLNSQIRLSDVTDGLGHTFFTGEKRQNDGDLGWISGTRATLRNTGTTINETPPPRTGPSVPLQADGTPAPTNVLYVGGFGSYHGGGIANFAFGDGSVKAVSETISPKIYVLLGNRADGQLIESLDTTP